MLQATANLAICHVIAPSRCFVDDRMKTHLSLGKCLTVCTGIQGSCNPYARRFLLQQ